jgi:hypothetical protein
MSFRTSRLLLRNGNGRWMEWAKMNGLGNDGWMEKGKGVPPLRIWKAKGVMGAGNLPTHQFIFIFILKL